MEWKDKRVVVIGAARQGLALGRFMAGRGAHVVMNDQKPADQLEGALNALVDLAAEIDWVVGSHPLSLMEGTDCICVSGGVPIQLPLVQEAMRRGILVTNDSQVFLEECPCRTIGITGSAGKTTTTSLVGKIAEASLNIPGRVESFRRVWVGGNIGVPLLAMVDEMHANDLAVIELSSFQLEIMTRSVDIACVLNITPNHLDRHASMEDYVASKRHILENQADAGIAVLGQDSPATWGLIDSAHGPVYSFGKNQPRKGMPGTFMSEEWICAWDGRKATCILRQDEIQLRGWHNIENIMAACAISMAAGLPIEAMRAGITSFRGVAHRLELIHSCNGIDWYNDSIATAPERVTAAIQSFESPTHLDRPIVLLAGGRDKKLPWEDLAELIHRRVDHLILFGEAAEKIAAAVGPQIDGIRPYSIDACVELKQAVDMAARIAQPGDIVLLSPGGTSFDEFHDFEERGEAFTRWVHSQSCM